METNNQIPSNWKLVKLREVCTYSKGKMPQILKEKKDAECTFPYINIKAFEKGIVAEYTNGVKCNLCDDGDLLMVWDGARCGMIGKAKKGAVGSTLMKILPTKNIHKEFLYHFIKSKFSTLNSKPKGVGIPHIEPTLLWNFDFPLAPLPEQHRIVSKIEQLLTDLDKGIEYLKTAQQQLKVYRQAVLMWTFEDAKNNNKRFLLKEVTEKIQIGPFGTQLHKEDYIENGIPLINPTHIQDGKILANGSFTITKQKRDSLPNYILEVGDVIMGRRGEMARCGLVSKKEKGWFCGTGSLYLRPKKNLTEPIFLYYFLSSHTAKKYLEGNAGGTTMANLNLKIVNNMPLFLPSIKEQNKIINEIQSRLSVCDKIEETIETSLLQSEALRLSILKKAFEGKLVAQNPNDEPAQKLLERIRAEMKSTAPKGRNTPTQGAALRLKNEKHSPEGA